MSRQNRLKTYKENPFTDKLVIKKKSKQVRVSPLGRDNDVLINQSTGEVTGTHLVTYKQVDDQEFIKLFTGNVALAFDLTSAGNKALCVMVHAQQKAIQKDTVYLDEASLEDFLESNPGRKCSMKTLYRGIRELEQAQIIAKSVRQGLYFINPSFTFNGDRIAFTTAIQRRSSQRMKELEDAGQQSLEL